jgi:hypothetical protein
MKTGVVEAVAAAILLTAAAFAALPNASTRGLVVSPVLQHVAPIQAKELELTSRTASSSVPGAHSGLK